jgi:membrane protein YqaA with SNARE-associated domain
MEYGYIGLFLASFLAATIVPFSSEAIFSGMLFAGFNPIGCLILASAGNWLGGMTSFGLGYLGKEEWIEKYLRIEREKTTRFKNYITGKEIWIAFFCWLPFIGDVLAVAMGLLKTNLWLTSLGMLVGKIIRYVGVMWLVGFFYKIVF